MKLLLIHISILFFICTEIAAQNFLKKQLEYADKFFNSGLYYEAITEYKRLLLFDEEEKYLYEANYKIGQSYKMGAKLDDAINYFSKALLSSGTTQERFDVTIEIIRSNILRRTTTRAFFLLNKLSKEEIFRDKIDEINYWRGWAFIFDTDWENAAIEFDKISSDHQLKKLCTQVESDEYSVTFAKVISYILPGSGQFYTGNYLSGLMSLGWNGLFGYLTVHSFIENRTFDGIMIGSLLWLRFYRGNYQNAEKFAVQKNIEISNRALRYLQNNYAGKKP